MNTASGAALMQRLGMALPIIQAPMAGTSTPALAAAVSGVGALGSIAVGAVDASAAAAMIDQTRALTDRPFNVNVFCHQPTPLDTARAAGWCDALAPTFNSFGAAPPQVLRDIYRSFVQDDDMLATLLQARPAVVSCHFGLPPADSVAALKAAGITLFVTVTSLAEAHAACRAGFDAVIVQGIEAGGHRGVFDPNAPDAEMPTVDLVGALVGEISLPVIAAGGIMTGADIARMLARGAMAAQLGTAFVGCPESAADAAYRAALSAARPDGTCMTDAISGRPARCLANRFTDLGAALKDVPRAGYPYTYDAGKALATAAQAKGETGFGAQWAGTGASRARTMPAADLVTSLAAELRLAQVEMSGNGAWSG